MKWRSLRALTRVARRARACKCFASLISWLKRSVDFSSPALANACKNANIENRKLWILINLIIFKIFKGHFTMLCHVMLACNELLYTAHKWKKLSPPYLSHQFGRKIMTYLNPRHGVILPGFKIVSYIILKLGLHLSSWNS